MLSRIMALANIVRLPTLYLLILSSKLSSMDLPAEYQLVAVGSTVLYYFLIVPIRMY
jgi:hypothetical protein